MDTKDIDLSYKNRATKTEYDIESLESLFTVVFMNDHAMNLVFFGDSQYDDITDDELLDTMKQFMSEPGRMASFEGKESYTDLDYYLTRVRTGDAESIDELEQLLIKFSACKPLPTETGYGMSFVEYCGWNSSRYDLPLMLLVKMLILDKGARLTPMHIRRVSDLIISHEGSPWQFPHYIEEESARWASLPAKQFKLFRNMATYADGHIDWARVAKLGDGNDETSFPPGLKKEMARFGLDIVIDDLVAGENGRTITKQDILDLVYYNVNDVLGTRLVGMNSTIRAWLETRDIIHRRYPYTSAKSVDANKLGFVMPPERDATAANLAGMVLIGEKRIRPKDNDTIQYLFPLPDHSPGAEEGATKLQDLLEFMNKNEKFMHPYLYTFFSHFRGKDTRSGWDEHETIKSQPITHKATMNCPYYRDGKPTDTYISVSTGGAHGSVMAGLSKKSPDEVNAWIKSGVESLKNEKPTIDRENVLHLDWSSFYPVMASKMKLYETSEGVDRYTGIIEQRIKIKQELPFNHAEWTPEDYEKQELQIGLKFVLNNATGAGNTHKPKALLPLDNKTISMRLVGNMFIWCLAQRLTEAGAFIIGTNTDGIYVTNISLEDTEKVVEGYVHDYGMDVEPEVLSRFINRDTSNRIEIVEGNVQEVRGRLRHGYKMQYTDDAIGKNVPYPIAVAHAAIEYMASDPQWLEKPYDKEKLTKLVYDLHAESETPEAWYQIHVGSGASKLTVDGVRQSKINRVVMTKPEFGSKLATERRAEPKKDEFFSLWNLGRAGKSGAEIANELDIIWADGSEDMDFSQIVFCVKTDDPLLGKKVPERLLDQPKGPFESHDEFIEYWKKSGAATMAVPVGEGEDEHLVVPKIWREGSLTHYTSEWGQILNSTQSLKDFDMSQLDVDAYVRWSENLLDGWKQTADVPDLGMVAIDDTVVEKASGGGSRRKTKRDKAIDMIEWLYAQSDARDNADEEAA